MKYSLIITAWREPETVEASLSNVLRDTSKKVLDSLEILVLCPDEETAQAAAKVVRKCNFSSFTHVPDPQKGKVTALNIAIEIAQGDILIFTDGDVVVAKKAIETLVSGFTHQDIGSISGRPVSADSRARCFGYWGNLLADAAHKKRCDSQTHGSYYFMSGYLYAIRRSLCSSIPESILVDDAYVTLTVVEQGFRVAYEPQAKVYVKYPKNFQDWIKQKKRSVGGYSQLKKYKQSTGLKRTFKHELAYSLFPINYAQNARELVYSLLLYPARLWLWLVVFWYAKFRATALQKSWVRIESSK